MSISRTSAGVIFGVLSVAYEQFGQEWLEASEAHSAPPGLLDLGGELSTHAMVAIPMFSGSHWMWICIQNEDEIGNAAFLYS